jgi:hypothetical protein
MSCMHAVNNVMHACREQCHACREQRHACMHAVNNTFAVLLITFSRYLFEMLPQKKTNDPLNCRHTSMVL